MCILNDKMYIVYENDKIENSDKFKKWEFLTRMLDFLWHSCKLEELKMYLQS